jgi:predicted RNase H-like HicB family nuclease
MIMKKLIATVEIWKEGGMFTAYCPELDIASCGHTSEEAKKNLSEVIEIQLEESKDIPISLENSTVPFTCLCLYFPLLIGRVDYICPQRLGCKSKCGINTRLC